MTRLNGRRELELCRRQRGTAGFQAFTEYLEARVKELQKEVLECAREDREGKIASANELLSILEDVSRDVPESIPRNGGYGT